MLNKKTKPLSLGMICVWLMFSPFIIVYYFYKFIIKLIIKVIQKNKKPITNNSVNNIAKIEYITRKNNDQPHKSPWQANPTVNEIKKDKTENISIIFETTTRREYPNVNNSSSINFEYDEINILTKKARKEFTSFIVFDLETTGLSANSDRIIEIGAVKIENRIITDKYQTLINPCIPIPKRATEVNHITNSMVQNAPTIEQVLPKFKEFIGNLPLIAHNASFDMRFLLSESNRCLIPINNGSIDTLKLSRKMFDFLANHKLATVANSLQIPIHEEHRALGDAEVTAKIFLAILCRIEDKDAEKDKIRKGKKSNSYPDIEGVNNN